MKTTTNTRRLILIALLFTGFAGNAQKVASTQHLKPSKAREMKTYLIEREIPNAGQFTAQQLKDISKKSCSVLKEMGDGIQWVQSYVTGNKIYCIYKAENEDLIREHAKKGGFPANTIVEVSSVISPATAR